MFLLPLSFVNMTLLALSIPSDSSKWLQSHNHQKTSLRCIKWKREQVPERLENRLKPRIDTLIFDHSHWNTTSIHSISVQIADDPSKLSFPPLLTTRKSPDAMDILWHQNLCLWAFLHQQLFSGHRGYLNSPLSLWQTRKFVVTRIFHDWGLLNW